MAFRFDVGSSGYSGGAVPDSHRSSLVVANRQQQLAATPTPRSASLRRWPHGAQLEQVPVPVGFKSQHPGGVHCLLGDTAVRFFADDTDYQLLQYLGAKASGHPVTLP